LRAATSSSAALLLVVLAVGYRRWRKRGLGEEVAADAPVPAPDTGPDRPRELSGSIR
jgi:hypothetical protein